MAFDTKTKFSGMIETETFAEGVALLIADLVKFDPTGKRTVFDVVVGDDVTIASLITELALHMFNTKMASIEIELDEDEDGRSETIWVSSK